jgi:dCMP deaminase
MANWPIKFLQLAKVYSSFSEDDSTKVGCVVFGDDGDQRSEGWNGLCRGVEKTEENSTRPTKYLYYEHAERNAFYNAARKGVSLKDASIATTHFPCADCARGIIQSGIKKVYYEEILTRQEWQASNEAATLMFEQAGIKLIKLSLS